MSGKVTKRQRKGGIAWILEVRFNFNELDKLKRKCTLTWAKTSNAIIRGAYNEALKERKRLENLTDQGLIEELREEVNFRKNIAHLLEEATARLDAEEREAGGHVKRGKKILAAVKKGHEARYGSQEDKALRWQALQAEVDRLADAHPKWSKTQIRCDVAKKVNVSTTTVRRRTQLPGKKK